MKSLYRIKFSNKKEASKFFKLVKALFILQTELPHYYKFETNIEKDASLKFYFNNVKLEYETLPEFIMEQYLKSISLKNSVDSDLEILKENIEDLIKEIADGENAKSAIGFAYLDEVQKYLADNQNIKLLLVDGLDPIEENISNNTYPVKVEGYLAIKESDMTNANVQKWLDAAFSSKGKEAIRKAGFVAVERISEE